MSAGNGRDVARQAANVFGAVFQVVAGVLAPVAESADENPTLVDAPGVFFAIWALIFSLCLAYAGYQALPSNRDSALLRRVGWFSAGAFVCNGLWEVLIPLRILLLNQAIILLILACTALAFFALARHADRRALNRTESVLVALPLGLLFGWITPAALVLSPVGALVGLGVLDGGTGEALIGAVLLLAGGGFARSVALIGRKRTPLGTLAYAAAVLWALLGVIINQYDASLLTTAAAVAATVLVASALPRPSA